MEDAKIEGVGVPVLVSGAVESVRATSNSPEDKVEALRRVHVFADLPDDQLQWFAENVQDERFAAGDILFKPLRSEEHTSELQSLRHLVCRLLLEKKNTH